MTAKESRETFAGDNRGWYLVVISASNVVWFCFLPVRDKHD